MGEWATRLASLADTGQRHRLAESLYAPHTGPLTSRGGVVGGEITTTTGMSVSVAPLRAWVPGSSSGTQGGYLAVLDAAKTLTFDDGDAQARTDLIVARVRDNAADTSGATSFTVEILKGTPGLGAPSVPASTLVLGEKTVAAGASAGSGGLGSAPTRPTSLGRFVAAGGVVPVANAAARDALLVYDGLVVYRSDTNALQIRRAGAWVEVTTAGSASPWVNLTPLPAHAANLNRLRYRVLGDGKVRVEVDGDATLPHNQNVYLTAASALPPDLRPTGYPQRGVAWTSGRTGFVVANLDGGISVSQASGITTGTVGGYVEYYPGS